MAPVAVAETTPLLVDNVEDRQQSHTHSDVSGIVSHAAQQSLLSTHYDIEVHKAVEFERNLSIREAVKRYPGAVFWSVFFSIGGIMSAFETELPGLLFATPAFQRDFGYLYKGSYIIPSSWQLGLNMGNPLGQMVGAFFASYPMERYGRKNTFSVCIVLTVFCILIQVLATSLATLVVGELLAGLVIGFYVVIAPTYASEVCPLALRGPLTSFTNLSFVIGQLIASCIGAVTSGLDNHWAYSAPLALQWGFPIVIIAGLPFAPESPWWLQKQGKLDEAEQALKRLASPGIDIKPALALIIETDQLEQEIEAGSTYLDCFNKLNRRRTEIGAGVYCIQVLSGGYLIGYATYFFEMAGLPSSQSFKVNIGFLALGVVGNFVSLVLVTYYGHRTIYNGGLAVLGVLMLIIGGLDCPPDYSSRPSLVWAQSAMLVLWNAVYDASIGAICFVILCEVSASRVRSKTIAIATAAQGFLGIVMTIALPYMLNADELYLRGKVGFIFGGLAAVSWIWAWLRVPELKGLTYEEIDILFEQGVEARDFKRHQVKQRDRHR